MNEHPTPVVSLFFLKKKKNEKQKKPYTDVCMQARTRFSFVEPGRIRQN